MGDRRENRACVGLSATSLGRGAGLGLSLNLGLGQELLLGIGPILGLLLDSLLLLELLGRGALGSGLALLSRRFAVRARVILNGNLILALSFALHVLVLNVDVLFILGCRLGSLALAGGRLGRVGRSGLIAVLLGACGRAVVSLQEALIPLGAREESWLAVEDVEREDKNSRSSLGHNAALIGNSFEVDLRTIGQRKRSKLGWGQDVPCLQRCV